MLFAGRLSSRSSLQDVVIHRTSDFAIAAMACAGCRWRMLVPRNEARTAVSVFRILLRARHPISLSPNQSR
jgi:hypothetical protein